MALIKCLELMLTILTEKQSQVISNGID